MQYKLIKKPKTFHEDLYEFTLPNGKTGHAKVDICHGRSLSMEIEDPDKTTTFITEQESKNNLFGRIGMFMKRPVYDLVRSGMVVGDIIEETRRRGISYVETYHRLMFEGKVINLYHVGGYIDPRTSAYLMYLEKDDHEELLGCIEKPSVYIKGGLEYIVNVKSEYHAVANIITVFLDRFYDPYNDGVVDISAGIVRVYDNTDFMDKLPSTQMVEELIKQ